MSTSPVLNRATRMTWDFMSSLLPVGVCGTLLLAYEIRNRIFGGAVAQKKTGRAQSPRKGGRVPRNTLSRDTVVGAALTMIDSDGLEAVTMPKLAQRLGVGTMSLYRHVEDKEDLVAAVAERVMSGIRVPDGPADDWEGRVVGYLRALRDAAV